MAVVPLEIRGQPVLFPIAIAGRIEAAAAAGFLGLISLAVAFGAPRCRLGKRPFGGRRQRALFVRWALGFGPVLRLGWHRPRLGVAVALLQGGFFGEKRA